MKKSTWQKIVAGTAAGVATVGSLGVAFGWWSTTGNGFGEGSTTAGVSDILTFDTADLTAMFPGDESQDLTVTVTNTSGESVYVDAVEAWVTTGNVGCDGSDFLLNGAAAPSTAETAVELTWTDQDMAAGSSDDATGTIQFNNKAVDQDACKGATVTVHYNVPAADNPPAED